MENIVHLYNNAIFDSNINSSKESIEFELTYHLFKSGSIYKDIFTKLKDNSSSIIINEYINIYYDNNIRVTKQFKHGNNLNKDTVLSKSSLAKPLKYTSNNHNIIKYNVKLNKEISLSEKDIKSKNIRLIKIKLRLSFILKDNDIYKIDLDLIKNVDLKQNNIKEIKNRIFKEYKISNITEDLNYDLFDELILETEFLNNKINIDDVNNSISYVQSLFDNNYNNKYQDYIYLVAQFIITNKTYLEEFKFKSGLKRLLNNVIEMNTELYYKNIQPQINNFYVTDKIDGQRCIIIIQEDNSNFNIKLLTNKLYQLSDYNENINKGKITILDSEFMISEENKNKDLIHSKDVKLYLFDIISYENNKIALSPFEDRFPFIEKAFNKIKFLSNIQCKEYIKLTTNYKDELTNFYNKKRKSKEYEIDGLIFTPTSKVVNKGLKYPINTNYNNMIGYKWKPIEEITIDFYIKKLPKNLYDTYPFNNYNKKDIIYILFSGISKYDYDKLNLTYMTNYKKIIPEEFLNNNYFPIQFSTSDNPINYIYTSSDDSLDNKIGEFNYTNSWKLKKIRYDRTIELERGEYFGNYFKIAELIWNNIKNPLTFDKLFEENTSYFREDDNLMYKAQRGYNSFVKTYILENIINPKLSDKNNKDWIIDLAAGKGQDMPRINNMGFKNGIFIDNDSNALLELINRKFNLKSQNKQNMKIYVQEINLTDNYKNIIKQLEKFTVNKESIDIMICNFAIHYLINNEDNLINLIKLLDYYLKPNGRFIFTCFNGYKIYKLLEKSNEWNLYENNYLKYSIKKKYNVNQFMNTGQKIDVLLPFSRTQYYTENLINLEYLQNTFNDNNFSVEISEPFSSLFNEFQNNKLFKDLTNNDKEFIDLYQFVIIKKNFKNNIKIKSNILEIFNIHKYDSKLFNKNYSQESNKQGSNIYNINQKYNINRLLSNIPFNIRKKLKYDETALFSLTDYKNADKISNIIKNLPDINDNSLIIDGTASIGGNSYSFSKYFNNIKAIELDKNRFDMLNHNIELLNLDNIETINDNVVNFINNNENIGDIIFFDPPWGGVEYKSKDKIDLYFTYQDNRIDIFDLCTDLYKKKVKYVIIKVPNNVNDEKLSLFKNSIVCNSINKFKLIIINFTDYNLNENNICYNNKNKYELSHLDNINNSNSILIIVNTKIDSIIKNIIKIFEDFNYKNKNHYKRNKNKIFKLVCFESDDNLWYSISKLYKDYSSIIFYNYNVKLNEIEKKYLIKSPILPIIINNLLIINNQDLEKILEDNEYFKSNKYISNNDLFPEFTFNNNKLEGKLITDKYYDNLT